MQYATLKMERVATTTMQEQRREAEAERAEPSKKKKKKVVESTRPSYRWFFTFNGWTGTQSGLYDDFVLA